MTLNWITLLLVMILLWTVYHGARRGFAYECGHLVAQLTHLVAGIIALWIGWELSGWVSHLTTTVHTQSWPSWAASLVQAWQESPSVAHMVAFIGFYLISSSVLHALFRQVPVLAARAVPASLARSHWLGAGAGACIGVARMLMAAGLVFLVTQYFTVPGLAKEAGASRIYTWFDSTVFKPWLKPFVARELPVLADGALEPLAKNINLFAVPTGVQGQQRGVLVIPKDINNLAHQIVQNQKTPRAKAHALYEWEIHHIHYDWNKYNDYVYHNKWDEQSPEQTLHTGKGVCADYALLYADLAHSAGLTVQIDEGIGGTARQYGPHAWNKVWDPVANRWMSVDTTWGSDQDIWFDPGGFDGTHRQTSDILVEASTS